MEGIINTEDLVFEYSVYDENGDEVDKNRVLQDITLQIKEGGFVAVLGHNGSGKSTLAKHFNGILLPTEGKVLIDGIDSTDESRIYDIRQIVGMVFQNPDNQIVATIVEEDVAFALENLGVEPKEIRRRVDEALKIVDMYHYREHAPHQLSGGQKQRIAIAGIIAMRPRCIVMDEPTAMLDPKGRKEIMATIKALNKEHGITVVLITHYMEEAAQADRVIVIDKGEILLDDVPKKIFSQVELLKSVGLDVPQATELMYDLRQCGVDAPPDIIDVDECAEYLYRLLSDKEQK